MVRKVKALFVGCAFLILFSLFNVYQLEQDRFIRAQEQVKILCDDASVAGALFLDDTAYSKGLNVFDQSLSEPVIKNLITHNMRLDSNLIPLGDSFWVSEIEYWTYYFDDNNIVYVYRNGKLIKQEVFVKGTIFTEPLTDYMKIIKEPTVITTIKVEYPSRQLEFLNWPYIVRSSAYENLDRN